METKANEKIFIGGGKSEVLLDEATNVISVAGVNIVTSQPGVGDILCRDESGGYRFIQLDTFQAGTFPSAWETLGVVAWRRGNQVKVVSKHNEQRKWMDVYPYVVTGYQLDGTEHTAQLRLHGRPSTETFYEFRYTAGTVDEFVTALQQFLSTNGETDWSAYKDDKERVILQYDNYTSAEVYRVNKTYASGLTLTACVSIDCPQQPSFVRKCGNLGYGLFNTERAKEYFKSDLSTEQYNPSEDVSSVPAYPVCWPAFAGKSQYQSDHCLWLRQQYCADPAHPKVEEWEAYIDELRIRNPYMLAGNAPKWRDGAVLSASLKGKTYRATDGTQKPLYPAVEFCSQFLDGKGYLPSIVELAECLANVTYGLTGVTRENADPISRSLYAIGGSEIRIRSTYRSSGRCYEGGAWSTIGFGTIDNNDFYYVQYCLPFALLELPAGVD